MPCATKKQSSTPVRLPIKPDKGEVLSSIQWSSRALRAQSGLSSEYYDIGLRLAHHSSPISEYGSGLPLLTYVPSILKDFVKISSESLFCRGECRILFLRSYKERNGRMGNNPLSLKQIKAGVGGESSKLDRLVCRVLNLT